jgi:hypothetical protein
MSGGVRLIWHFLQESFDPIIQATTGRDLIPAMVYGYDGLFHLFTCIVLKLKLSVGLTYDNYMFLFLGGA